MGQPGLLPGAEPGQRRPDDRGRPVRRAALSSPERAARRRGKDWTMAAAPAASLRAWRGVHYDEADIFLTNGAFAGLTVCLRAVVDPGDEVIYVSPPWFFYAPL